MDHERLFAALKEACTKEGVAFALVLYADDDSLHIASYHSTVSYQRAINTLTPFIEKALNDAQPEVTKVMAQQGP